MSTNLAAFQEYFKDESRATLVLNINDIDETLSDENAMSAAWGMLELAKSADFKQGKTSITYSDSMKRQLMYDAERIFIANDETFPYGDPTVTFETW